MSEGELLVMQKEINRLKERLDNLSQQFHSHRTHEDVIAQQVFSMLEFYREFYASSEEYQTRFQDILSILRRSGGNDPRKKKFMTGLADLLEECNKEGEWPGLNKDANNA